MEPERAFAGKTRVIKIKGYGKGRRGIVKEVDLVAGRWLVQYSDTLLVENVNPYEFDYDKEGDKK